MVKILTVMTTLLIVVGVALMGHYLGTELATRDIQLANMTAELEQRGTCEGEFTNQLAKLADENAKLVDENNQLTDEKERALEQATYATLEAENLQREIDQLYYNQLPTTFVESRRPGEVIQVFIDSEFEYRVTTVNAGSKSQGFEGELFNHNEPVIGPETWVGERLTIETPWGTMEWLGNPERRSVPWQPVGWRIVFDGNKVTIYQSRNMGPLA